MLEEEGARYTESHHIILCGDFNSRAGRAPDYDNNINVLTNAVMRTESLPNMDDLC